MNQSVPVVRMRTSPGGPVLYLASIMIAGEVEEEDRYVIRARGNSHAKELAIAEYCEKNKPEPGTRLNVCVDSLTLPNHVAGCFYRIGARTFRHIVRKGGLNPRRWSVAARIFKHNTDSPWKTA